VIEFSEELRKLCADARVERFARLVKIIDGTRADYSWAVRVAPEVGAHLRQMPLEASDCENSHCKWRPPWAFEWTELVFLEVLEHLKQHCALPQLPKG
jgi:hypothetical protein